MGMGVAMVVALVALVSLLVSGFPRFRSYPCGLVFGPSALVATGSLLFLVALLVVAGLLGGGAAVLCQGTTVPLHMWGH